METNPPAAADAPVLRELAALHVGPGEKFDDKALGLFSGLRWKLMLLQLKKKLQSESERYTRQMGQWIYFGDPHRQLWHSIYLPYHGGAAGSGCQHHRCCHLP